MLDQIKDGRYLWGLIVILIIYSSYYLLLADSGYNYDLPKTYRHFFKMLVVILVYSTGTYFLGNLSIKWIKDLWHIIHISLITLLIGLWAWHFGVKYLPLNLRRLGYSIHEFLISPLLYLATGLMGTLSQEAQTNTKL